jgi:hypothetical protein
MVLVNQTARWITPIHHNTLLIVAVNSCLPLNRLVRVLNELGRDNTNARGT